MIKGILSCWILFLSGVVGIALVYGIIFFAIPVGP